MDKEIKDFWVQLPDDLKTLINKAKIELDNGECISHEDVIAEVKKRYTKLSI